MRWEHCEHEKAFWLGFSAHYVQIIRGSRFLVMHRTIYRLKHHMSTRSIPTVCYKTVRQNIANAIHESPVII